MINRRTVFEIHQLQAKGFSCRSIARQLQINRETVAKYLAEPSRMPGTRKKKPSKLDPYQGLIEEMVKECPDVKAPVVLQRIREKGFDGKITIVRDMLRNLRGKIKNRQPYIPFESQPGEQVQVDWGHMGTLSYGETKRKLYALAVLEGHSRILYVFFSHSQQQMRHWLDNVANVRKHHTTGQRPVDRLHALRPVPDLLPDCRQVCSLLVHKDFGVRFDTNVYTVPPWAIGKHVTLKADTARVSVYFKDRLIASHTRCWDRRQRIELDIHKEQVKKIRKKLLRDRQVILFLSLGEVALHYLQQLTDSGLPIRKNITQLLSLQDEYGDSSLLYGLNKAMKKKLYGADYVRNILYQEMTPVCEHPPVRLKQENLNEIRLTTPALADYDSIAIKRRNSND